MAKKTIEFIKAFDQQKVILLALPNQTVLLSVMAFNNCLQKRPIEMRVKILYLANPWRMDFKML